jgi:UDPglucose--hexose-1-phosphate uridylyltransferase
LSELRWHPFLKQWVAVTTHRQNRPQMPQNWCPFCPGSGRVPDDYTVHLYPNDFAAFAPNEDPFVPGSEGLYATTGARGACDVVLYSPEHNRTPAQLSEANWLEVIGLWTRRTEELYAGDGIAYVAVFENQGEAIGVTMPHPHGQIYALPVVPPYVAQELASALEALASSGHCLHCGIVQNELSAGDRLVCQNDAFVAFVPFYGRFPSEVHLYSKRHVGRLAELDGSEQAALANLLSILRRKYDALYGFPLPMIMAVRQAPPGTEAASHLHIQFLPIQRSATKLKYMAAIESAHGTFLNDTRAEDQAAALRAVAIA